MKWTVVFAACMALVAVQAVSVQNDLKPDMSLMMMNKYFHEMLQRVDHPLQSEELIKLAGEMMQEKIMMDKTLFTIYDQDMQMFVDMYMAHQLPPMDGFFTPMQHCQSGLLKSLFKFLYYAKDCGTMMKVAAWARMNVNPAMFVHALTMAVNLRQDMQGFVLPQIYEILPQMFLNSKYIMAAEKFDYAQWNRMIMLEKELKGVYMKQYPSHLYGKEFFQMGFKAWQWWKLMGLDDGWHLEGKCMLRENYNQLLKDPMWVSIHSQMQMFWMPIDYSRDVDILNEEAKMVHLTEDVEWNSYWYYLNMQYSTLLEGIELGMDMSHYGEWWIYNVQQLLARYTMERMSQGLGLVKSLPWYGIIKDGYDPQLIAYNGNGFTMRKNYVPMQSLGCPSLFNNIVGLQTKIQEILMDGQYTIKNGTMIDLTLSEGMEFIGYMLQGNVDIVGMQSWFPMVASYLGGVDYHQCVATPNVLLNYESMFRDPLAYQMLMNIMDLGNIVYKQQLAPYTKQELLLPGVKILNVDVSPLKTYFDLVDLDMTTLLNDKMVFHEGKFVLDKVLLGRQMRLNHEPFKFEITVDAAEAQQVVVRIFIGTLFDQYGQKMDMASFPQYYMELDEFMHPLVAGQNTIVRDSEDFAWTSGDRFTSSEIYNYLQMAIEGKYKFNPELFESQLLFPDRLVLPQGWVEGMPIGLFFMISPYHPPTGPTMGPGKRHVDNMPFGYPLNRPIPNLSQFIVPNMYYKTAMIYHKEKFSKYFPMMYEHFGVFDESF